VTTKSDGTAAASPAGTLTHYEGEAPPVGWSWREGLVVELFGYRFAFRIWVVGLVAVVARLYPFGGDWPGRAVFTVAVLAAAVVHELAHAAVARRRGLHVSVIRFNALGGFTVIDDFPTGAPGTRLLVAGAGPVASIVCGLLAFVVAVPVAIVTRPQVGALYVLVAIGAANVVLALLNLLPISPFDGGHIVTAVLERATGSHRRAQRIVGFVGLAAAAVGAVWVMVRSYTLNIVEPDLIAAVAFIGFCAGLMLRAAAEPAADDGHEPVPSN
jgi:Zn-dependent protease